MKILVTGNKGQLGADVVAEALFRNYSAIGVDITEMDITDYKQTKSIITDIKPEVVIHCAAWTAVDLAETNESQCRKINIDGTENVALVCSSINCKMIYISTDYVFDGTNKSIWETEDKPNPINIYGKTKYQGEQVVKKLLNKFFIIRTSWVFGKNGNNFVKTMLRLGREKNELFIVSDQYGSPTYTVDLARLLIDFAESDKYGVYHATNEGYCNWYEFAKEIFKQAKMDVIINPVSSAQYPAAAKRPINSRLNKQKLSDNGFERLPIWQDALQRYLLEILRVNNEK